MKVGGGIVSESGEADVFRYIMYKSKNKEIILYDVNANHGDYAIEAIHVLGEGFVKIRCFELGRQLIINSSKRCILILRICTNRIKTFNKTNYKKSRVKSKKVKNVYAKK